MQVLRISLITFLLSLWTTWAYAIEVEVKVYEKGANALEARKKALAKAERRGFETIIQEKVAEQAQQIIKDYKTYDISPYILGYHSKDEAVTDTSYRATLVLDYDDRFIANTIQQPLHAEAAKKRSAERLGRGTGTLIIPIFRNNSGVLLWEDTNLWREQINRMVLQHGNQELVVPYGDPTDMLSLNANSANSANFARLSPMMQRYGANRVLLATLHSRGLDGMDLTLREISQQGDALNISHIAHDTALNLEMRVERAAQALVTDYRHRQQTAQAPDAAAELILHEVDAYIKLSNARDWNELRIRLNAIEMVEQLQVLGAEAQGMLLKLAFRGDPKLFGEALVANGIAATQQNDQLWLALR